MQKYLEISSWIVRIENNFEKKRFHSGILPIPYYFLSLARDHRIKLRAKKILFRFSNKYLRKNVRVKCTKCTRRAFDKKNYFMLVGQYVGGGGTRVTCRSKNDGLNTFILISVSLSIQNSAVSFYVVEFAMNTLYLTNVV